MRGVWLLIGLIGLIGSNAVPGLAAGAEPDAARTLKLDAVELIGGREAPGIPDFSVAHEGYLYYFATAANREAFLREPQRYEIQLGGACARMGPLSGDGSTRIYAVHDGKLYLFASEACRKTFLAKPEKLLETDDPKPAVTPESARRGRELLDRAVAAMGGAERLDAIRTYRESAEEEVKDRDKTVQWIRRTTFAFPRAVRYDEIWGEYAGGYFAGPEGACFIGSSESRPMAAACRAALWRKYAHHPVWLLRARNQPDFTCAAAGPGRIAGLDVERVIAALDGASVTLGLNPESGQVVAASYRGRGPDLTLGTVEKRFEDVREVAGLRLPYKIVTASFEGQPVEDSTLELTQIELDAEVDPAIFRPATATEPEVPTKNPSE